MTKSFRLRSIWLLAVMAVALLPLACASSPSEVPSTAQPLRVASLGDSPTLVAAADPADSAKAAADTAAGGKAAPADKASLAKAAQNPIANMISLPVQYNANFNFGPEDDTQHLFLVQPVLPLSLGDGWTLINRMIMPVISQPSFGPGDDRRWGLGNTSFSAWFTPPAEPGEVLWGVGPVIQIPTSTGRKFGPSEWGLGPTAVVVAMPGKFVLGGLINNVWGFDNPSTTNLMTIQPFINYNLSGDWYLVTAPIITSNWLADDSQDQWTIPLGAGVGKIFHIGSQAFNASVRAYYNVRYARNASNWTLQLQLVALFPTK